MQHRFITLITILTAIFLMACGAPEKGSTDQPTEESSSEEQNVLILEKEAVSEEGSGRWLNAWYIEDSLYFVNNIFDEESDEKQVQLSVKKGVEPAKRIFSSSAVLSSSVTVDEQGNVYYITKAEEDEQYLVKLDAQGEEMCRQPLSEGVSKLLKEEMCIQMAATEEGCCAMTAFGATVIWDGQLCEKGQVTPSWRSSVMEYDAEQDYGLVMGAEGAYAYYRLGDELVLQLINMTDVKLEKEERLQLPETAAGAVLSMDATSSSAASAASTKLFDGYERGIYISKQDVLCCYQDRTKELSARMEWEKSTVKVDMNSVEAIREGSDGSFLFAAYDMNSRKGTVIRAEETVIENRETVILGYLRKSRMGEQYINSFNAEHGDIQIVGKQYEDLTSLHLDLLQGEGPDLIDLAGFDIEEYVEKGILENLDPYFAASDKISADDLLPSLRETMTRDGGIRYVFPNFKMNVLIMNADTAENAPMTTEEFLSLRQEGEYNYLTNTTPGTLMLYLLPLNMDQYVDWGEKSCHFADEQFISFLKLLKDADLRKVDDPSPELPLVNDEMILDGQVLAIYSMSISSLREYRAVEDAFGNRAKVVSLPTWNGEEVYPIYAMGDMYAINSASEKKAQAWEFLEYYLLEYGRRANGQMISFSVLWDCFESQLYPQLPEGSDGSWYRNPYMYNPMVDSEADKAKATFEEKYDYTEEERDAVRHMVEHAKAMENGRDGVIGNIVMEEALMYLEGDKTAEEVAEIIQSRVSIYMAE